MMTADLRAFTGLQEGDPEYKLSDRDVCILALSELRKAGAVKDDADDAGLLDVIARVLHTCSIRKGQIYTPIRQRGRKTCRWANFMTILREEVAVAV